MTEITKWLMLLVLTGEVVVFAHFSRVAFGTWITPFNLIALPYVVVVWLASLFAPALGFVALEQTSMSIWIVGLLLFWVGSLPVAVIAGSAMRANLRYQQPIAYEKLSIKLALILAWACIPLMLYRFLTVGGFSSMASEDDYLRLYGGGLVGHLMTLCYLLLVVLINSLHKKNKFVWITTAVLFFLLLMYPVKSWLFMPVIAGLIYRIVSGRLKASLKIASILLVIVPGMFLAAYTVVFAARSPESLLNIDTYLFLARTLRFLSFLRGIGVERIHACEH